MLQVSHLKAGYFADTAVVHDVSLCVEKKQIVAIIGSNGVGKTTCLRAITGLIKPMAGSVVFEGEEITGIRTFKIAEKGIAMVPEGRMLFGKMSVMDNLLMGAYKIADNQQKQESLEKVYSIFPRVKERSKQLANTLSGGEQQMVAIARGLMSNPKLLILDEPSLGLAPKLVDEVFEFILKINDLGVTILIVEQNATKTLSISDYAYVIKSGENMLEGSGKELLTHEAVKQAYLGLA